MVCPPPPPRTKWTRRVPHPVLIGHAVCLVFATVISNRVFATVISNRVLFRHAVGIEVAVTAPAPRITWTRRVPHPVLIGHAVGIEVAVTAPAPRGALAQRGAARRGIGREAH